MFEQKENLEGSISIEQIKEVYRDHPSMQRINAFKEELKQEKLQDKAFCQSIKNNKNKTTP